MIHHGFLDVHEHEKPSGQRADRQDDPPLPVVVNVEPREQKHHEWGAHEADGAIGPKDLGNGGVGNLLLRRLASDGRHEGEKAPGPDAQNEAKDAELNQRCLVPRRHMRQDAREDAEEAADEHGDGTAPKRALPP